VLIQLFKISLRFLRYFDVKVCTYRSAFYGEHGLYSRCLAKYMREMRTFLDAHPQEVAILHFQRLSQLEKSEKRRLVTSLFQVSISCTPNKPVPLYFMTKG